MSEAIKFISLDEIMNPTEEMKEQGRISECSYRRGYTQALAHVSEIIDEKWMHDWESAAYEWRYRGARDNAWEIEIPPGPKTTPKGK